MIYCRGCLDPGRLCVWWALSACSITHMPRCQWASPVAILWGPSHGQAPRVIHGLKGKLTVKVCVRVCVCVCVCVAQSCPNLCDPMDCKPSRLLCPWDSPGKNTGVVAISFSEGASDPGIEPRSSALQADSLPPEPPGKSANS